MGRFTFVSYIVVGDNGYIISSSKMQRVGTNNWNAITYGNGMYVAIGNDGYIAYSSDGDNWTTVKLGYVDYSTITYTNGKFIALGGSSYNGKLAHSEDGINWTSVTSFLGSSGTMTEIAYRGEKYCFGGYIQKTKRNQHLFVFHC